MNVYHKPLQSPRDQTAFFDIIHSQIDKFGYQSKSVAERNVERLCKADQPLEVLETIAAVSVSNDGTRTGLKQGEILDLTCNLAFEDFESYDLQSSTCIL